MAYTFEELAKWWSGNSYPVAYTKLLIAQEDGRTAYGDGFINLFYPTKDEFNGQFAQQFNDRTRQLMYGPPAVAAGVYVQNFDKNAGIDLVNFAFTKIATGQFQLQLTLLRWGNAQININLTKAPRTKLYTGYSATIGNAPGLALYVLSINGAEETPG